MSRVLLSGLAFTAIYLLVLTSVDPGDVLVGAVLGLAIAYALRPRDRRPRRRLRSLIRPLGDLVIRTAGEMAVGSWRTARYCLRGGDPGIVEIPRSSRSAGEVALWGVVTGEAPDEFPVDVDEERDVLLVHLIDASDPDAVRARHARNLERWRRGREDGA